MRNFGENDTIVAIATPPGEGGIGIVRVSGENAGVIAIIYLRRLILNIHL